MLPHRRLLLGSDCLEILFSLLRLSELVDTYVVMMEHIEYNCHNKTDGLHECSVYEIFETMLCIGHYEEVKE